MSACALFGDVVRAAKVLARPRNKAEPEVEESGSMVEAAWGKDA